MTRSKATEHKQRAAAEAAAALVSDGTVVGLGTGSTAGMFVPALAARGLDIRCVCTSPATEERARAVGLQVVPFEGIDRIDIAVDGADQVDPAGWLVKGAGGAHTREKIVAAAADRFVVIVSEGKLVEALAPPVPLELLPFGLDATLRALEAVRLRDAARTPDGGILADFLGPVADPAELCARLAGTPGVVEHGIFPPDLVSEVLIGNTAVVERRVITRRPRP